MSRREGNPFHLLSKDAKRQRLHRLWQRDAVLFDHATTEPTISSPSTSQSLTETTISPLLSPNLDPQEHPQGSLSCAETMEDDRGPSMPPSPSHSGNQFHESNPLQPSLFECYNSDESTDDEEESALPQDEASPGAPTPGGSYLADSAIPPVFLVDDENPEPVEVDPSIKVTTFLRQWFYDAKANRKQLDLLCRGLKAAHPHCFSNLPIDSRTYLKTPRTKANSRPLDSLKEGKPGKYIYIGLRKQLESLVPFLPEHVTHVMLLFNIDGTFLDDSGGEFWPVQVLPIAPGVRIKILTIAMFYGVAKPKSNVEFLEDTVNDMIDVLEKNVTVNGRTISVSITGFPCDIPARNFLLGTTGHTGYYSCHRCTIPGEALRVEKVVGETVKIVKKRVFKDLDRTLRTDEQFRSRADIRHRPLDRTTPLLRVPGLDLVHDISCDYMHNILIGITKTLLFVWFSDSPFKCSPQQKNSVSEHIRNLYPDIPKEFARQKPRDLDSLSRYKATELRMMLLYLGPVVLKDVLTELQFTHFLMLHIAISILVSENFCSNPEMIQYARKLLRSFVSNTPHVYSAELMTLNWHMCIHLPDDIEYFRQFLPKCTLDTISSFPFENELQYLKHLCSGYANRFEQIDRRIRERLANGNMLQKTVVVLSTEIKFNGLHYKGPLPIGCKDPQFSSIVFPDWQLSISNRADSCCIFRDGTVMLVENIASSTDAVGQVVIGRIFMGCTDLYSSPCRSSILGILKSNRLSAITFRPVDQIIGKCVCFRRYKNGTFSHFCLFPLLHTIEDTIEDSQLEKALWSIVKLHGEDFDVIPNAWVTDDQECLYPKAYAKVLAQRNAPKNPDWQKIPMELIRKNYDNYMRCWIDCKAMAKDKPTQSAEENEEMGIGKRRKIPKNLSPLKETASNVQRTASNVQKNSSNVQRNSSNVQRNSSNVQKNARRNLGSTFFKIPSPPKGKFKKFKKSVRVSPPRASSTQKENLAPRSRSPSLLGLTYFEAIGNERNTLEEQRIHSEQDFLSPIHPSSHVGQKIISESSDEEDDDDNSQKIITPEMSDKEEDDNAAVSNEGDDNNAAIVQCKLPPHKACPFKEAKSMEMTLQDIARGICLLSRQVDVLERKLITVEEILGSRMTAASTSSFDVANALEDDLPIRTLHEFEQFCKKLEEKEFFTKITSAVYSQANKSSLTKTARSALKIILHPLLYEKINMCGLGQRGKAALNQSKIHDVLKAVVEKAWSRSSPNWLKLMDQTLSKFLLDNAWQSQLHHPGL